MKQIIAVITKLHCRSALACIEVWKPRNSIGPPKLIQLAGHPTWFWWKRNCLQDKARLP